MATSFEHKGHHQAILQKLRKAGTVGRVQNLHLYGIPFTFILMYY